MASSTISSGNVVTRFRKKVLREYVRGGRFGPVTGTDVNKIIQIVKELKKTSIPLVAKLSGPGVRGSTQLSGSESPLSNFSYLLQPTYLREGVLVDNEEREKSEFDLFSEARPALMNWIMETKRDQMIQGFGAIEAGGTYYNYGVCRNLFWGMGPGTGRVWLSGSFPCQHSGGCYHYHPCAHAGGGLCPGWGNEVYMAGRCRCRSG